MRSDGFGRVLRGRRSRSRSQRAAPAPARARARAAQTVVTAVGFVVGAAMLATASAGSAAVRDRAAARELARLGASERLPRPCSAARCETIVSVAFV